MDFDLQCLKKNYISIHIHSVQRPRKRHVFLTILVCCHTSCLHEQDVTQQDVAVPFSIFQLWKPDVWVWWLDHRPLVTTANKGKIHTPVIWASKTVRLPVLFLGESPSSLLSRNRWRAGKNWTADPSSDWVYTCSATSLPRLCCTKGWSFYPAGEDGRDHMWTHNPPSTPQIPYWTLHLIICDQLHVWRGSDPRHQSWLLLNSCHSSSFYRWFNWGIERLSTLLKDKAFSTTAHF